MILIEFDNLLMAMGGVTLNVVKGRVSNKRSLKVEVMKLLGR